MIVLFLIIFLIVINSISILAFKKRTKFISERYIFPAVIAISLTIATLVFGLLTASRFMFQPYSMGEAIYDALFISLLSIALVLSIPSFLAVCSGSIQNYISSHNNFFIKMNFIIGALFILSMLSLPRLLFHYHHINRSLSIAPKAFNISEVIYAYNTYTGFGGPGDWEMGLNIYKLPNDIVSKIQSGGVHFLNSLPLGIDCETWYKTPILNNDGSTRGYSFLSILGDSTEYDREIKQAGNPEKEIDKLNQLIGNKNSFYCSSKYSTWLISPEENWLVLYY